MGATENLSKNLRALRTVQGYSLVRFAEQLHISKSTLQEIEHGHPPHLDTVECISRSLGIPVSVLLSDSFSMSQHSHMLRMLLELERYAAWEPSDQDALIALCQQVTGLFKKYALKDGRAASSGEGSES